jgi:dTDP-4-dehydrorhamnose reductase
LKILLIGASGMLGTDLVRALSECRHELICPRHAELDITDSKSVREWLLRARPDAVVLSAAYTRVDDCETHRDLAFAVNAEGPRNVAVACREAGAKLLFVSTDYVFNGRKNGPYVEDDPVDPLNVYGLSKLAGENHIRAEWADHLIVRTSWLYGLNGKNFVETIIQKAATAPQLRIVDDQRGAPTFTKDLAEGMARLLANNEARGVVNVTNSNHCTWFEFAKTILQLTGLERVPVHPVTSAEFKAPAQRPANSVLSSDRFTAFAGQPLRPWQDALQAYLHARASRPRGEWS